MCRHIQLQLFSLMHMYSWSSIVTLNRKENVSVHVQMYVVYGSWRNLASFLKYKKNSIF